MKLFRKKKNRAPTLAKPTPRVHDPRKGLESRPQWTDDIEQR